MIRRLMLITVLLLAPGCVTGDLHEGYIQRDRATLDAFKQRIPGWIDSDETMDGTKKDDYRGLLRSWEARVEAAERELAQDQEGGE